MDKIGKSFQNNNFRNKDKIDEYKQSHKVLK